MAERSAAIFGATGLVGNLLLEELTRSREYSSIRIFVRQPSGVTEPGVEEIVADFSNPGSYSGKITADDLFICLGTTIRKAGSVQNMEKIDRDLPVQIARMAQGNGVKNISVVSSIGAAANSGNYYLRIKGEMEREILNLEFENVSIVRPSMLLGERKEKRVKEIVGMVAMKTFKPILIGKLLKYRAIHARDVARAMMHLIRNNSGKRICESDELQKLARDFKVRPQ